MAEIKKEVKTTEPAETPAAPEPQPEAAATAMSKESVEALAKALLEQMKPTDEELKAEAAARKKAQKKRSRQRMRRDIRNLLVRLLLLIVVVYVLFFHIVGITVMPNDDMYPRIDSGDLVLFYRLDKDVRTQDIIVLEKDAGLIQTSLAVVDDDVPVELTASSSAPTAQESESGGLWAKVKRLAHSAAVKLGIVREEEMQMFICRVVATAGDTVEITEAGSLLVNGNHLIETNIFSQTTAYLGFTEYPLTLKAGECFVMADKRNGGADSRFFGAVNTDEILGTVITIVRRNNL